MLSRIELNQIQRGDIFLADLRGSTGCEQKGERPVLIIQNDVGNSFSPTIIVASITSQFAKAKIPTHVEIAAGTGGIEKDSIILLEQIRTIDKIRIRGKGPIARLDEATMKLVDEALSISKGLSNVI